MVEFGLHCFTKGPNYNQGESFSDYENELHYADDRETRIFCFDRYDWSKALPDIIRSISDLPCYYTGKGNFFILRDMKTKLDYEVYFNVTKNKAGPKGFKLRLYVESAYIRTADYGSERPELRKINFFLIAHKKMLGK